MTEISPSHAIEGPTLRLIFEYQGDNVKLVETYRTNMKIPRPVMQHFIHDKAGFWIALEDDTEKTICQCFTRDPIRKEVEIHNSDGSMGWKENPNPKGHFMVLVPELENARYVSLHRSTATRGRNLVKASTPRTLFRAKLMKPKNS